MDFFSTNLFNWYGLAFAIALLVPDIVYIKSNRIDITIFDNRAMLYIERIGKYCSIFLMGINIGVLEGGFTKPIMGISSYSRNRSNFYDERTLAG